VTLFVRKKRLWERLAESERIPKVLRLESIETEVVTDVVEVGSAPVAHVTKVRPLRPGCGGAHFLGEEGTFGLFVRQAGSDEPLVLSCSHVLARSGLARPGDVIEQPLGGAAVADPVAKLTNVFSMLTRSPSIPRTSPWRASTTASSDPVPPISNTRSASVSDSRLNYAGIPTRPLGLTTPDARGATADVRAAFRVRDSPGVGDDVQRSRRHDSWRRLGAVVVTTMGRPLPACNRRTPTGLGVFLPLARILDAWAGAPERSGVAKSHERHSTL
jgi:hypothetical protein